jgi:hypothetical protein
MIAVRLSVEYVPVISDSMENDGSILQTVLSPVLTHLSNIMAEEPEGSTLLIPVPPSVTVLSQFFQARILITCVLGGHSSFSRGFVVSSLRNVAPFMQPEGSQEPNTGLCPSVYSQVSPDYPAKTVYFSPDHSCYMSPSDPHGLIALIIYI